MGLITFVYISVPMFLNRIGLLTSFITLVEISHIHFINGFCLISCVLPLFRDQIYLLTSFFNRSQLQGLHGKVFRREFQEKDLLRIKFAMVEDEDAPPKPSAAEERRMGMVFDEALAKISK